MVTSLHVKNPIYPLLSIIASILILVEGMLIAKSVRIIYLLLALSILYIIFGYGRVLMKALLIFIPISFIIGGLSGLTASSYAVGMQTFGRTMLMALSAITIISTPPIALTRNLTMLKCPRVITLGMLVTVRFVPILVGESKQIIEAMKTRGVNTKWYNVSLIYRSFLIPFIMRIVNMSDIMSLSMETRGFDLAEKSASVYREIHFTKRDGIYTLCLLAVMIGVLYLWR
jgi:energy-coupling factor transport system permease protein